MARAFRKGDFRAGYYRDQTMMLALGMLTVEEYFAQLYGDAELASEPAFGGRSMTGHFATRLLNADGSWKDLRSLCNSSADVSPTGAQMPRLLGLAYASVLYRRLKELQDLAAAGFSDNGNEIAFGTIGNASCAEGIFWEAINAAGVLQVPMLLSIWDDGYGISVPNQFQMTKGDIYRVLEGFQRRPGEKSGLDVYAVAGWNYPLLCETYHSAAESVRRDHVPVVIHVTELTQPLGHSTSGSQQRYKSPERLAWEKEFDCIPEDEELADWRADWRRRPNWRRWRRKRRSTCSRRAIVRGRPSGGRSMRSRANCLPLCRRWPGPRPMRRSWPASWRP